jgi:uncharacterized pyridoxal phosphate-containing UPF0001 family protein
VDVSKFRLLEGSTLVRVGTALFGPREDKETIG